MTLFDAKPHPLPAKTYTIGMWLFLLTLTMLFLSGMVGYLVVRFLTPNAEDLQRTSMPWLLFVSTAFVVAGSVTVQWAVNAVRQEKQADLRKWLGVTLLLAALFTLVQIWPLWQLFQQHASNVTPSGVRRTLAGLIAFFILLHAAHVIGGVVYLIMVYIKAARGGYDHEHHVGVHHAALYWHFLDIIWIAMFGTMLLTG